MVAPVAAAMMGTRSFGARLRLPFDRPTNQPFPTDPDELRKLMVNAGNPTSIHVFDEASGDALDKVGSNDLTYGSAVLRRQRAVGLPTGSDMNGTRCAQIDPDNTGTTNNGIILPDPGFAPGTDSFAHLVVFRFPRLPSGATRNVISYRDGSTSGYLLSVQTDGDVSSRFEDADSASFTSIVLNAGTQNVFAGAWTACMIGVDRSVDQAWVMCADGTRGAADVTGYGTFTSSVDFILGNKNNFPIQVRYHAYWSGTAAEGIVQADLDAFWRLHKDPTRYFDVATHASTFTDRVGNESGFGVLTYDYSGNGTHGRDQMPLVLRNGELGLNRGVDDLDTIVDYSNDFGQWTNNAVTRTANDDDSPWGFREATLIEGSGVTGHVRRTFTCVAETEYRFMVAIKAATGAGHTVTLAAADDTDSSFIAESDVEVTDEWAIYALALTTEAGQTNLPLYIYTGERGVDFGDIHAIGATCVANVDFDVLIRTFGATATRSAGSYRLTSNPERYLDLASMEVRVDMSLDETDITPAGVIVLQNQVDNIDRIECRTNQIETPRLIIFDTAESTVLTGTDANGTTDIADGAKHRIRYIWDSVRALAGNSGGHAAVSIDGAYDSGLVPPTSGWTAGSAASHEIDIGGASGTDGVEGAIYLVEFWTSPRGETA